jgi:hypothetical protein
LAVQFISIKEAGFNRKATRGPRRAVAFLFDVDSTFWTMPVIDISILMIQLNY